MRPQFILRACRSSVQLWRAGRNGLVFVAEQLVDDSLPPDPVMLAASIEQLLSAADIRPSGASKIELHAILESAWLPVIPLATGGALWSAAELDALLRHRLEQTYADESNATGDWGIRIEHRPGDELAIGYALDPAIKDAVVRAVTSASHKLRSVQPSFSWGWQRLRGERRRALRANATRWWVWLEADRALAACVVQGQVVALNPAADFPVDAAQILRLSEREAARSGIDAVASSIVVADWSFTGDARRLMTGSRLTLLALDARSGAVQPPVDSVQQIARAAT